MIRLNQQQRSRPHVQSTAQPLLSSPGVICAMNDIKEYQKLSNKQYMSRETEKLTYSQISNQQSHQWTSNSTLLSEEQVREQYLEDHAMSEHAGSRFSQHFKIFLSNNVSQSRWYEFVFQVFFPDNYPFVSPTIIIKYVKKFDGIESPYTFFSVVQKENMFIDKECRVQHKILRPEQWKPTSQLNIVIMALEFELIHILSNFSQNSIDEP